jgi:hypothetical protein
MKPNLKIGVLILSVFLLAFTSYTARTTKSIVEIPSKKITNIKVPSITPTIDSKPNSHSEFLKAIGFKESGNRYNVVNRFGYMGKYQFGKRTLRGLGFKISKEEFLNSPEIQEEAMYKLLQQNKKSLRKYINKYNGKIVHGVLVTESGLLAAAHLGGAGSVKKWFRTGKIRKDGNGVKITTYMERFAGYDLYL